MIQFSVGSPADEIYVVNALPCETMEVGMQQILVIDDEAFSRHMVRSSLVRSGLDVVTAPDGEEALRKLASTDIGLIITDIEMPHMSGYALANKLNEDERYGDIPLIFLTAHDAPEARQRGFDYGACDYLTKPVNVKELTSKIINILMMKERSLRQANACVSAALESLPMPAAFVDGRMEVRHCNEKMRETGAPLSVTNGRLTGTESILAMVRGAVRSACGEETTVVVRGEDFPVLVKAQPVGDDDMVLITASAPGWMPEPSPKFGIIFDLYDFTARQREVATLLMQGHPLRDVMELCEMARSTINVHLRQMFEKTGTNRQQDLVMRLVLGVMQIE